MIGYGDILRATNKILVASAFSKIIRQGPITIVGIWVMICGLLVLIAILTLYGPDRVHCWMYS